MFLDSAPHETRADSGRVEPNIDTTRSLFKRSLKIRVTWRRVNCIYPQAPKEKTYLTAAIYCSFQGLDGCCGHCWKRLTTSAEYKADKRAITHSD
jgi:hypothetical protein